MIFKRAWLLGLILFAVRLNVSSTVNADDLDSLIVNGNHQIEDGFHFWDEKLLKQGLSIFKKAVDADKDNPLLHYYVGMANYRLANIYAELEAKKKVKFHLEGAIMHLERAVRLNRSDSESHALLAACYGMKISTNPFLAIKLGPRSDKHFEIAVALNSANPRIYLLRGIGKHFTPRLFGGGNKKALADLRKAQLLFDRDQPAEATLPDWGRAELHAWLGKINMETRNLQLAQRNFDQALELQPNFKWLKEDLIPQLQKIESK